MADIKITELPQTTNVSDSDELIVQQPTGTKRTSISNLPAGVPDGGTIGQVLTKQSSTDGDVGWDDVDKMDFVSSPTANHFLTTNSSGQAIDSGIAKSLIGADTALNTTNKTIIPAINELNDKFAYPKQYSATGLIVNGSSLPIQGHGTFTATFFESGLVRVDFAVKISAGSTSSLFNFGINKNLLSQLVPSMPEITPTNFAGAFTYYDSNGAVNYDLTGYGGLACNPTATQFWGFGRTYNTSGNKGGWPASGIAEGTYITGCVYGTYTV